MTPPNDPSEHLANLITRRDELRQEIRVLNMKIETLQEALGLPLDQAEDGSGNGIPDPAADVIHARGASSGSPTVRPDTFFGMSQTAAAEKYLRMVGHAVHIDEIRSALERGGIRFGGAGNATQNLYIQLVKGTKRFALVGKSVFGLREFYPQARINKASGVKKMATRPTKSKRSIRSSAQAAAQRTDAQRSDGDEGANDKS